jgi:hypothetical protein
MSKQTPGISTKFWLLGVVACFAALYSLSRQHRIVTELRATNEVLIVEQKRLLGGLSAQETASGNGGSQQSNTDQTELMRLRNEVTQLRELIVKMRSASNQNSGQSSASEQSLPQVQMPQNEISQLAKAAIVGDLTALEKISELSAAARMQTNGSEGVVAGFRAAFDAVADEAGKGNESALRALLVASRMKELDGYAIKALGKAAAMGNEGALEPLLDPENNFILRSSAVSALKPAADAGNARAVDALAATAVDPKAKALWYLAAQGLREAAKSGNVKAIDTLATLVKSENQVIRREAFTGLEAAAIHQPRAAQALQGLYAQ